MRGESHRRLGYYLAEKYMRDVPRRYVRAFLIGCVEPDRNPATYIKGSIRCQRLRGHNYENARRYMQRLSLRLERKERLYLLDYYAMGKLIHYTVDAFTLAHNDFFPESLREHRAYEAELQEYFLSFLAGDPPPCPPENKPVMDIIRAFHRRYEARPAGVFTDVRFAFTASCLVAAALV